MAGSPTRRSSLARSGVVVVADADVEPGTPYLDWARLSAVQGLLISRAGVVWM